MSFDHHVKRTFTSRRPSSLESRSPDSHLYLCIVFERLSLGLFPQVILPVNAGHLHDSAEIERVHRQLLIWKDVLINYVDGGSSGFDLVISRSCKIECLKGFSRRQALHHERDPRAFLSIRTEDCMNMLLDQEASHGLWSVQVSQEDV